MTITGCYKRKPGFKIRKMTDVRVLLDELLMTGEWNIIIDRTHVLHIAKKKSGEWEIGEKTGNIYDIFNPILIADTAKGIRLIWTYRKYVNEYFFSED